MENSKPSDFLPLKTWFLEYGKPVFGSDKLLHYHTKPIQKELIEAKTEAIQSAKRIEELYSDALDAMKNYSGQGCMNDDR